MNRTHLEHLASPQWAQSLRTELLPWLETVGDLGDDVLEVGPGPGLTTDLLRDRAAKVTAVEIDPELASALALRLADTNVDVLEGDAVTLPLATGRFTGATAFSMLHHMPTSQAQDDLFGVLGRVLTSGGLLVGVDSIDSEAIRAGHLDDVFVPVPQSTLRARLEAVGFRDVVIAPSSEYQFRFHARKAHR